MGTIPKVMWIIPKTLSHFVPDTEGLRLELSEQAWMLESSAMWRSKPSSKQTWLRRLKKGGWITHLSTRILKPSLHESFVEKYTDSLEDIHASHSVQQGSDKERKTQDTYGHTSSSTSGQLDLFGAFGKMSQDTPRWGYGESCPIWKKKVTDARGVYSQRKKLALHTKGNECSSWPTARTSDSIGHSQSKIKRVQNGTMPAGKAQLREWVQPSWATPQASDHIEGARTAKESNQKCLGRDLNQMNWPTPRAGNPGSRKPGTGGKILAEEAKKNWPTPLEDDSSNVNPNPKRRDGLVAKVVIHNGLQDQEKSNTSGKNHGSWPTARSSDAEGGRIKTEKTEKGFRSKREKSDQYFGAKLRDAAEMEKPPSMKLNPNWVEQLMGLSTGWTDLGSWGMELSHKQQN